jgi:hypothetical protein
MIPSNRVVVIAQKVGSDIRPILDP